MRRIKGLSLFANVGVAESYLADVGVDIVLANEILKERADFYKNIYPNTEMICGDITDDSIRSLIVSKSIEQSIEFIIATPPCQGMSRHGKQNPDDERNYLIYYAIDVIKKVKPKYVLLENVPKLLSTYIYVSNKKKLIPEYLYEQLSEMYNFPNVVLYNAEDYGVPQSRERCIYKLVRRDIERVWIEPQKSNIITLEKAIGNLPSLDPRVRDGSIIFPDYEKKMESAMKISKWHYAPIHNANHVAWMMHTPTGKTAFYNEKYYPQKKGEMIKGRLSCYRRMSWDKPANTITQNNGVISSSCCVHPGRFVGYDSEGYKIYSDPRVLTIYELMVVSSLPSNWAIPEWATEKLIRNVIGEGIPPMLIKRIVEGLPEW